MEEDEQDDNPYKLGQTILSWCSCVLVTSLVLRVYSFLSFTNFHLAPAEFQALEYKDAGGIMVRALTENIIWSKMNWRTVPPFITGGPYRVYGIRGKFHCKAPCFTVSRLQEAPRVECLGGSVS